MFPLTSNFTEMRTIFACLALLLAGCQVPTIQQPAPAPAQSTPPVPKALLVAAPKAPLAVMATTPAVTGSTVTLAWNPSTSTVAGYRLYYGAASGAYTNRLDAGASTNATVSGLASGTTYYFAATDYTSSGIESGYSTEISYSTPAQKKTVAIISTYVETSTNGQFSGWAPVQTFPDVTLTNPPSPIFYRTRLEITYTNEP